MCGDGGGARPGGREIRTHNDIYLTARRRLRAAGVSAAALEARLLCAAVSGKTREAFLRDLSLDAPDGTEAGVDALLARRLAGEPVAYLLGEWEFYAMPIRVTRVVLIPRADTEALAAAAIRLAGGRDAARVLDLCAGSGCVGLAVAANVPRCRVVAADKSAGALAVAQLNATQNGLESRVTCVAADALAPPPPALGEFDLIVCNPPYIPTAELDTLDISVRDYEPRLALDGGEDGLLFYRAVAGKWGGALRGDGFLLFECGAGQAADVRGILEKSGFGGVTVTRDTGGVDRVVVGQKCISDIHA